MSASKVQVVRTIQAPPGMIFEALTRPVELRQWLCHEARIKPHKGGRFEVRWDSGYEASGVLRTFSPPAGAQATGQLGFTWLSAQEPGETSVRITLQPAEGGTQVKLVHSGFGTGKKWAGRAEESEQGWQGGLDNLKSLLETGIDLREAQHPHMGVSFKTVEGDQGTEVIEVIPGAPAAVAGLQTGDIILSLAGRKTPNEHKFLEALGKHRAGQKVKLLFLRGGERHTITLELGGRPVPPIPDDPAQAVEQARRVHEQALAVLRAGVAAISDEQAGLSPAEGEWSVKHALAHLCVSEREYRSWVSQVLLGDAGDYWIEARLPEQFAAVLSSTPSTTGLIERLERELAESRAMVAAITPAHRAYKARYRRVVMMLMGFAFHVNMHLEQIIRTVQTIQEISIVVEAPETPQPEHTGDQGQ